MASDTEETTGMLSQQQSGNSLSQLTRGNNSRTHLKLHLQDRLVQATFELAKQSFANAKYKKTYRYQLEKRLRQYLPQRVQKWLKGPNLLDFKRAYSLIHDWYPKLVKEVRVHNQTWTDCKKQVLYSMKELLRGEHIAVDDDSVGERAAFGEWADQMLQVEGEPGTETIDSDFPCCQEDDPKIDIVQQNLQTMHALLSGAEASTFASFHQRLFSIKMPILRVMWIIMMVDAFFLTEAGALGMLTQLFFELTVDVDLANQKGYGKRNLWWFLLPSFAIAYSVVGSQIAQLTHDAVHYPPFNNARATLIIMCSPTEAVLSGQIIRRPIRIIDFCLSDGLLLFVFGGATMFYWLWREPGAETYSVDLIFDGMNAGALLWTSLLFGIVTASRAYCYIWLPLKLDNTFIATSGCLAEGTYRRLSFSNAEVKFNPTRCAKVLRDAMEHYDIRPGVTWKYFLPMKKFIEIHKHDDEQWLSEQIPAWIEREDPRQDEDPRQVDNGSSPTLDRWEAYSAMLAANDSGLTPADKCRGIGFSVASFFVWLATVAICLVVDVTNQLHVRFMLGAANVGLALTLFFASLATETFVLVVKDSKDWFRFHTCLFVVCIFAFSFATFELDLPPGDLTAIMTKGASGGEGVFYNDGSGSDMVSPYPVCSMTWGSPQAKVHLLDLAAMSYYAYVPDEKAFGWLLNESFGSKATNIHYTNFSALPRVVASRFCDGGNGTDPCTIVVAVKGTSTKLEVMADLGIFSTITILQMLDKIAPLLGTIPQHLISVFIDMSRTPFLRRKQHELVHKLINTTEELRNKHPNDKLVVTGHSLGGSFAEIIGGRLRIPAVGFSAPGHFYLMRSLNLTRESVTQHLVTIMPSLDPVPQLASHLDVVQRILCRGKDGKYRQPLKCHSIEITTCELWRVCGDEQKRDFSKTCLESHGDKEAYVDKACIGQSYSSSDEHAQCRAYEK